MFDFHKQLLASLETERALQAGLRRSSGDLNRVVNVYISGPGEKISATTAKVVADRLHAHPNAEEVRVYIASGGGAVAATVDIIAALWAHSGRKVARIDHAGSGAFMIALACDHLIASPEARFLHHSPHAGNGKPLRVKSVSSIYAALFKRQRITSPSVLATLERWGNEIRTFTAEEAKALCIVDEIDAFTPETPDLAWMRATDAQDKLTAEGRERIAARRKPIRERHERRKARQVAAMRAEIAPLIAEARARRRAKLAKSLGALDALADDTRETPVGFKMVGGRKMPIWANSPAPSGII